MTGQKVSGQQKEGYMREEKHIYLQGVFTGALCAALLIVILAELGIVPLFWGKGVLKDEKAVRKLETLDQAIDTYYLEEPDEEDLKDGMYYGLVAGLNDPYSRYYSPEEYKKESQINAGTYVGIGVTVQKTEKGIRIVQCYEGGNADKAGVKAGDMLLAIDGEDVTNSTTDEVVSMIREQGRESAVLTLEREGETAPLELTVAVSDVNIPVVSGEMLDEDTGYLKIREFSTSGVEQFRETLASLKEQEMKRLIVDLRNNQGGLVSSVCDILREILPEGLIVYTEDKNGNREEETCSGEHPLDIPLVVLVNHLTASASEIFAGAVQDYGIGTIVGTTTYGKGIVQTIFSMKDGSAIKLTVANYYTPNGHNIHKKGITPDVEVELKDQEEQSTGEPYDSQLQEALRLLGGK